MLLMQGAGAAAIEGGLTATLFFCYSLGKSSANTHATQNCVLYSVLATLRVAVPAVPEDRKAVRRMI